MKVLIITYYWPPAGGSGVQRWLKFVKYFKEFGVEPVIYTVQNPNYPILDESLEEDIPDGIEVLRQPIWEPNNFLGRQKQTSAGFLNSNPNKITKLLHYIRANFFIPDARKYWIKPSINFLEKYLKDNPVDVVITTGPPHSLHLIGLGLKKQLNVKWISDFRDPWLDIDYFHQLPLTKKALKKHQDLETEVLRKSDGVVVVGESMRNSYSEFNKNVHVVTNGYDTVDSDENFTLDEKFSLTHIGLMNSDRNPRILWKALNELCNEVEGFSKSLLIRLVGRVDESCLLMIEQLDLRNNLELIPYVPHQEVQKLQKSSQVLLLAINKVPSAKGIITGKIFEYLNAKRPILAIGPEDGDLAKILNDTNAGGITDFNDTMHLKRSILEFYKLYKSGNLKSQSVNISQFHRKNLTEQLSKILKEV